MVITDICEDITGAFIPLQPYFTSNQGETERKLFLFLLGASSSSDDDDDDDDDVDDDDDDDELLLCYG